MTRKKLSQHHATFESIKHSDDQGNEFWLARQHANVLEYSQYRHFLPVIERAREACSNSGQAVADHIEDILTMVDIGSGAKRQVEDRCRIFPVWISTPAAACPGDSVVKKATAAPKKTVGPTNDGESADGHEEHQAL